MKKITRYNGFKLKKKAFIQAYVKAFGNVTVACQAVEVDRATFYQWMKTNKEFKTQIESLEPQEVFCDFLESKLVSRVQKEDTTAIIFALKTKAKHRGYIEKTETDINFKREKHTIKLPDGTSLEI